MSLAEAAGSTKSTADGANSSCAWFCVRSQPKHEHIAAANLRTRENLEVFNPRIRFKRPTRRGPIWVTESLFPSYLFARFDWTIALRLVHHTPGVAGVVHFGSRWPTIPDAAIEELRAAVGSEEVRVVGATLQTGDEIHIAAGVFSGLQGIITRVMPAQDRVAVLLDFLGRQTTVELPTNAVIKKDPAVGR